MLMQTEEPGNRLGFEPLGSEVCQEYRSEVEKSIDQPRWERIEPFEGSFFQCYWEGSALNGIRDSGQRHSRLESIHMLLGVNTSVIRFHVGWGLETLGWLSLHNEIGEWRVITILGVLVPFRSAPCMPILIPKSSSGFGVFDAGMDNSHSRFSMAVGRTSTR